MVQLDRLDLTAPTADQLRRSVKFVEERAAEGIVYVHCTIGYSRSAAVVAAYLAAEGTAATADECIARLRDVRPTIVIRPEAEAAIRAFCDDSELMVGNAHPTSHRAAQAIFDQ